MRIEIGPNDAMTVYGEDGRPLPRVTKVVITAELGKAPVAEITQSLGTRRDAVKAEGVTATVKPGKEGMKD